MPRRDKQASSRSSTVQVFDGLEALSEPMAQLLQQVGLANRAALEELGAVGAYVRVKRAGLRANLNLLYSLEGLLRGVEWTQLPYSVRASLTLEADAYLASEGLGG